jgi:stearoyl-CoA desaturase (Delta-9 desaturase)
MPTAIATESVSAISAQPPAPAEPAWDRPRIRRSAAQRAQLAATMLIVTLPLAGVVVAATALLGAVSWLDLVLLVVFYTVSCFGVTVGYHRLFTHRSFTAVPGLRLVLALAGGLAFEGGPIGWVANHRRHHAFSDRPGDPHSPHQYGGGLWGQLRGFGHAHMGWLFGTDTTSVTQYAPDLEADRTLRVLDRAFPASCAVSLGLPMLLGWLVTGTLHGALTALVWGGLVRVFLVHQVTWSVNSLCHMMGARPFKTRRQDRSTNLWPLAILSFGESWHNMHHADPSSARHGVDPHQIDLSAGLIRLFERFGWASKVQWPDAARLAAHRPPPAGHPAALQQRESRQISA